MSTPGYATVLLLLALAGGQPQRSTQRMIDRCAQDGSMFDAWEEDSAKPAQGENSGVTVRIERPDEKNEADVVVTYSRKGHILMQKQKDFDAAYGWLTVSSGGDFAVTWNASASATSTQLFDVKADGELVENTELIPAAEKVFFLDAAKFCKTPGANTTAVKWKDNDHLLIAINAWTSGFCSSNFTEGFIIDVAANHISGKLTERELLNLPAVCTWNVVPVKKH